MAKGVKMNVAERETIAAERKRRREGRTDGKIKKVQR